MGFIHKIDVRTQPHFLSAVGLQRLRVVFAGSVIKLIGRDAIFVDAFCMEPAMVLRLCCFSTT